MEAKTPTQIDAEVEALRARIRRLRLERKVVVLAAAEDELLRIADGKKRPATAATEGGDDG